MFARLRRVFKAILYGASLPFVFPCAVMCWLEAKSGPNSEDIFLFCANLFSMIPGPPGLAMRAAFYRLTLDSCTSCVHVSFGAMFTHRQSRVEDHVSLGPYALIGCAVLRKGCQVGSRVSLLSGHWLHELDEDGHWGPFDHSRLHQIEIGAYAWIGEAAVVMDNVGAGSMVAAGSVVSSPVPSGIIVAGNPARFVRKTVIPVSPTGNAERAAQECRLNASISSIG
jgi:acetyltransferase-like isoleucine patch superfamily enzyme